MRWGIADVGGNALILKQLKQGGTSALRTKAAALADQRTQSATLCGATTQDLLAVQSNGTRKHSNDTAIKSKQVDVPAGNTSRQSRGAFAAPVFSRHPSRTAHAPAARISPALATHTSA